ncbi:MAG TPA: carbohydrate ABC transporter permease [Burkholderiales bacterium]|nr:carbohydrate ABC transporter permease [Burkholderiales bacterium]
MRRALLGGAIAAVVASAAVPLLLIAKQAMTPERESFAWPPAWLPHEPTLENFRHVLAGAELFGGLVRSVGVAAATVISTLALTLPAAWLGARAPAVGRRLDAVLVLTRVLPSIAIAVPLAVLFVRAGLYNDPSALGLWLAHTLLGLPLAFFVLRAAFAAVPVELEQAARLDGASALGAFVRVSMPLARPALATASLLVFLLSWDEFAFALLLQVTNRTLPPLLYYLSAFGFPGLSSALAAIMVLPALVIVILLEPAFRSGLLAGSGR